MPRPTNEQDVRGGGPADGQPPGARKGMTRRGFVIKLGAGATVGIAGYFLLSRSVPTPSGRAPDSGVGPARPQLKADVVFGRDGEMATITRGGCPEAPVCAVNAAGAAVLNHLDGRHSIEEISRAAAYEVRVAPSDALSAKVAYFVAQLAMLEFLQAPFYARIFEHVES